MGDSYEGQPVEITPGTPADVAKLRKSLISTFTEGTKNGVDYYPGQLAAQPSPMSNMAADMISRLSGYGGYNPAGAYAPTGGGGTGGGGGNGGGGGGTSPVPPIPGAPIRPDPNVPKPDPSIHPGNRGRLTPGNPGLEPSPINPGDPGLVGGDIWGTTAGSLSPQQMAMMMMMPNQGFMSSRRR